MDAHWQSEFRGRMQQFGSAELNGFIPISIKVLATTGCFDRSCCPHAHQQIEEYLPNTDMSGVRWRLERHESGPEILVYLAVTAAGLNFAKSIIDLVTAILKARSEGVKKGDRHPEPVELIVRGYAKNGEYFEGVVLRVPHEQIITAKQVG
ncbi:MAG: hypothetical protein ACREE6_04375, partial [Limisphaerales bacterium]